MRTKRNLLIFALIAVFALVGATAVGAQEDSSRTITVSGLGYAAGEPDVAYVELGVETVNADLSEAFSAANTQMNALIEAIVAFGIAREDIQTTMLNVYQEDLYDPNTGQPTGERRFHVQNFVRVTVRDTATVGDLVSMAVEAGANRVNSLSFGILELSELESEARADAVANARERAEQLASLLGLSVGEPVAVRETLNNLPVMPLGLGGGRSDMAGVPVQGGQLEVSVQIEVTFALNG